MVNPMADFGALRTILKKAQNIVVLTGAGISAESGIPTFRGSGGFWRNYQSQDLATVGAFKRSPTLVWEFYHYRRELVLTKQPNAAHIALAKTEDLLSREGRKLTIITQNIDGLHQRAGSKDVVELHGSLFKTLCMKCSDISVNTDSPICPSLLGKGAPDAATKSADIPEEELPRCKKDGCGGLLRPYVVWFGENLHPDTLEKADSALSDCEACLVVGTSSVVYPAAMYAPQLASRNIPVAEFNIEVTPATDQFMFHFHGPSSETIPKALEDITCSKFERSSADRTIEQPKPAKESLESMRLMTKSLGSAEEPSEAPKSAKDSVEPPKEEGGTSILTGAQKLKQAVRDYGSTVIVFHVGMSLMSLGGFYLAFSSGVDMSWLIEKVGLGNSSLVTGASTFVLAYAVHKVFAPVRISITLGATPFIVRYLRSVGILKPPK